MSLSPEDIKKVAHLARLTIQDPEMLSLAKDMDNILSLVQKMNGIDIANVNPMFHPLDMTQPLRGDDVTEKNQRELFLKNAPQSYMSLFLVPRVIEHEE
jgi:aspartyl-tRNA(Asn)/glutamyl-tRNA(Gln) amidotransferase subunit C